MRRQGTNVTIEGTNAWSKQYSFTHGKLYLRDLSSAYSVCLIKQATSNGLVHTAEKKNIGAYSSSLLLPVDHPSCFCDGPD